MIPQDKSDDEHEKTETEDTTNKNDQDRPSDEAATTDAAEDAAEPGRDAASAESAEDARDDDLDGGDAAEPTAGSDGTAETSGDPAPEAGPREPDADPRTIDLDEALGTAPLVSDGTPPEPEPEPEPHPEPATHEHEEEHHRSLAARVLTWLLLLIAGGAIALWGAPKVAPHLPSGLGPVKAWLMPGALEAEAEIDALAQRLEARIDAVEQAAAEPAVTEEQIQAAIADLEGRVTPRLDELADQVGATDRGAAESRLTQLETKVEGLIAQIEELTGLGESAAELSDEELARISTFSSTVEGLRAEVATLAEKQGALSQRIDEVDAAAQRRLAEAEEEIATATEEAQTTKSRALAQAAATSIDAAMTSGDPYEEALAQLQANTDAGIPDALEASASTGVTPLGTLRESFPDAAHAAIRASIRASENTSVGGRLAAFIEAQVASRSLTPQPGDSTDAILSRAEEALRHDNLAAAVSELESLSEPARAAMQDWIAKAEARVAARSALADVTAALGAAN